MEEIWYGVISFREISLTECSDRTGNLVHLEVMGQSMLIINDSDIAIEILDKHSNVHSGRPVSNMISLCAFY